LLFAYITPQKGSALNVNVQLINNLYVSCFNIAYHLVFNVYHSITVMCIGHHDIMYHSLSYVQGKQLSFCTERMYFERLLSMRSEELHTQEPCRQLLLTASPILCDAIRRHVPTHNCVHLLMPSLPQKALPKLALT
jgi:hypothetical protein